MTKPKLIRVTTVPLSLNVLLKGQLKFLSHEFEVIGISSAGKDLNETAEREGVRVLAVDMERGIHPFKDLISLYKLYKQFKKEKPQIVHSITPKAGLLTMLAGKLAGVPIRVHTFTGLIFPARTGFIQKLLITMDQLLCWASTNIYPEGNGVKSDLISYRITSKPLKVLANGNVNGIDLEHFSIQQVSEQQQIELKKALNINENDFVFVFVGRLVSDKGINELITAFSNLKHETLSFKLLLVGWLETELDSLSAETLKEIETNPNIIFVGFQSDVRPYFAVSDALVFPSYREGFPNVVMQAGAMELPSIVTNINGCNEIVIAEKNGIIIPVKNMEAVQEAMKKLMNDKYLYDELKQNARPMIASRYEQRVVWNAIKEEYQNLLKEKNIQ